MHVTTQGKCSECGAQFDGCHALFSKVETLTLQRDEACRVGEEFRKENRRLTDSCNKLNLEIVAQAECVRLLEKAMATYPADVCAQYTFYKKENALLREALEAVVAANMSSDITAPLKALKLAETALSRQDGSPKSSDRFWCSHAGMYVAKCDDCAQESIVKESEQDNNDPERPLKPGEDPLAPHRHIFTEKAKAQCDCESPQGDHYTDCGSQAEVCEHCGKEMENDSGLTIHERTCKSFEPVRCPHGVILDDPDLRLSCQACEEPKPNYFEILQQVPSGEQGESPRLSGLIEGKGRLNPPPVSSEQECNMGCNCPAHEEGLAKAHTELSKPTFPLPAEWETTMVPLAAFNTRMPAWGGKTLIEFIQTHPRGVVGEIQRIFGSTEWVRKQPTPDINLPEGFCRMHLSDFNTCGCPTKSELDGERKGRVVSASEELVLFAEAVLGCLPSYGDLRNGRDLRQWATEIITERATPEPSAEKEIIDAYRETATAMFKSNKKPVKL